MKRLLLFIILFPSVVVAQDWSPVNLTDKYNYRLDNDPVITQTTWQTNYSVNGSDTTFFFNTTFCDTCVTIIGGPLSCDSCYAERNLPRFFGRTILKTTAGICNFRAPGSKMIELYAQMNDTWLFDTLNNITAQVIFSGTGNVLSNTDSVKTLLLSTGDTVQFSKNYGITIWPNGYGQNSYYRLAGIHGRDIGTLVPRMRDYFNFNVGDMFEYHSISNPGNCINTALVYDCVRKYTITSAVVNGDTLRYHASGVYHVNWSNYNLWTSGQFSGVLNYDILVIDSADHLGNHFNNELIISEARTMSWWCLGPLYEGQLYNPPSGNAFNSVHLFTDSLGIEGMGLGWKHDVGYNELYYPPFFEYASLQPGSDTLFNGVHGITNHVIMKKGLGQVGGYYDCHFECFLVDHLEAYRKGNDTVGVFTTDDVLMSVSTSVNDLPTINVYPNPSSGTFTVQLPANANANIEILDLQGRVVKTFTNQSGQITVLADDLADGIYLLKISTPEGNAQRKIVISH